MNELNPTDSNTQEKSQSSKPTPPSLNIIKEFKQLFSKAETSFTQTETTDKLDKQSSDEKQKNLSKNQTDSIINKKTITLKKDDPQISQLFQEMGFHGSTLDYSHPSNSYMNEVMDDREGLPITLSVLFIELANRLDLPVSGLGLPGHFIAVYSEKIGSDSKEILIDPFGGKIVTRKEAAEIVGVELSDRDFIPAKKKDIVLSTHKLNLESCIDSNDLAFGINSDEMPTSQLAINDVAHTQIASHLDIPKRYYDKMRLENNQHILKENVKYWFENEGRTQSCQ